MVFNAMKIYRNYDNQDSMFGDVSVSATGSVTQDDVATYAAVRSLDSKLTIMVINKHLTAAAPATVSMTNYPALGSVEAWQLTSSNVIQRLSDLPNDEGTFSASLPPQSITLFVAAGAEEPLLHEPRMVSGNTFGFILNGQASQSDELQGSSNLTHWIPLQTNAVTEDPVQIVLPATEPQRFFRARLLP